MKVVVVGLGYVGLPLAVRAAEVGHAVVGVDMDPVKIDSLSRSVSYIEDVTDGRLRGVREAGRFHAVLGWQERLAVPVAVRDFDIAVIAVPTPLRQATPDLSHVRSAGSMLGHVLRHGAAVVLESTSYPGTTEGLLADVLHRESGLVASDDFHLGFSPERIDPGNKSFTLENTPKLVSATTSVGLEVLLSFYDTIVERTVPVSSPRVAELAKIFENTQACVNIALINEVAGICHDMGINVHEMVSASMTKGHSMAYWTPGPGVGGHCLPIDPLYLAWQTRALLGRPFKFAELAEEINSGRPGYVVDRLARMLNDRQGLPLRGTKILVMGVAYKPNVGDLRESPALPVIGRLLDRGAEVTIVDPHVDAWALTPQLDIEELAGEIANFPAVLVITDHQDFDFDKIADTAQLVLDCRNAMPSYATNVVLL